MFSEKNYKKCKILTWTNESVYFWNSNVRRLIYGDNQISYPLIGELIVGYSTVYENAALLPTIETSAEYIVIDCHPKA